MTIPFANSLRRLIPHQPRRVGLILAGAFIAWAAILGYSYFISTPPSESDIVNQSVQLNATKLQAVTQHLATYRQVIEVPTLPDSLFASPKP